MNGPEHYREAERLIAVAQSQQWDNGPGCGSEETLAEAQVHATLALVAATAWGVHSAKGRATARDVDDWAGIASRGSKR